MVDNIILLIGEAAVGQDDLIELLIKQAKQFILLYCGLDEYSEKYDTTVIRMVIEDWNKRGSEGLSSRSFSGLSENFTETAYSPVIMSFLDKSKAGVKFY